MQTTAKFFALGIAAAIPAAPAHAALIVSSQPTRNVTCAAGVCTATAADAVMNAGALETMLQTSGVELRTEADPVQDLVIRAKVSWAGTQGLTLTSSGGVHVNGQLTVQDTAHLTVTSGAGMVFGTKGGIKFRDLASRLTIDGTDYRLVNSVAGLAAMVARHPNGAVALANDYDAAPDGQLSKVPVPTPFGGTFEGLGNRISNFHIWDTTESYVALFAQLKRNGIIRDLGLTEANVLSEDTFFQVVGTLAAFSNGTIARCYATGQIRSDFWMNGGGLVGENFGNIFYAWADVDVSGAVNAEVGGLIGNTHGHVHDVYALGRVIAGDSADIGGLVGYDIGHVSSAYATGSVGGGQSARAGGLVGVLQLPVSTSYWDIETSGTAFGAGGANVDGITGLTTAELQAALPGGFDPAIWGQDPTINNGLPYLLSNPPR